MDSCCSRREGKQVQFPLFAPWWGHGAGGGRADPLYAVRVGLDPRVGQKVWLRRSAYSLGGITCRVHVPCFCSWLFGSDSWVFLIFLYLVIHNFPQLHICTVILGFLIVPLYFVAQGEFCPGASTAAKDPRSQPVSWATSPSLQSTCPLLPPHTCHHITRKDRRMMQQLCGGSSSRL